MPISRRLAIAMLVCLPAFPAVAANLPAPNGQVLLTVGGEIALRNSDDVAQYDRDMLEALDWRDIESYTYYTEGLQQFSGPTLASLLDQLGVEDGILSATALDDYTINIPVADLQEHDIILAMDHNGQPMRVRNRGPIWIVYPASSPDQVGERHISHMIWQLKSIFVQP